MIAWLIRLRNERRSVAALLRGYARTSLAGSLESRIERRLLALLIEHTRTAAYGSLAVIAISLWVATTVPQGWLIAALATLRSLALAQNVIMAQILSHELAEDTAKPKTIHRLSLGLALSAFFCGAMVWPLQIESSLDFPALLIVIIALFSVCLSILSAGYHRPTLVAVCLGGTLGLLPKIVMLLSVVGPVLLVGFLVYLGIIGGFARLVGRQSRGGVVLQMRFGLARERLAYSHKALEDALEHAQWLAGHDSLTQLRNRRAFEDEVAPFTARFAHRQFCLMVLDIDHFKHINDRFGHQTGDGVLMAIGTALRQWEREGTGRMTGRWGGEEFIALVGMRKGESLSALAEDLRKRIEVLSEQLHWPGSVVLTTSIGCTILDEPAGFDAALFRADGALYAAKDSGRNCWKLAA